MNPIRSVRLVPIHTSDLNKLTLNKGEIFYDVDAGTLTLLDGTSKGGKQLLRADLSNLSALSYIAVSDTAPTATKTGTLWFDSANGKLYVYFIDSDGTAQWVQPTSPVFGSGGSVNVTNNNNSVQLNANALLGDTLAHPIVNSSLTTLGTLSSLKVSSSTLGLGNGAAPLTQGDGAVAIGKFAAGSSVAGTAQGANGITIGTNSGYNTQSHDAIAIGTNAGNSGQGANSIAIGANAGYLNQTANSIVLNASGAILNGSASGFYVNPVRSASGTSTMVYYNTTTNEMTYGPIPSSVSGIPNNIPNTSLINSSVTVTAGTGLSGGGSVALGSSITLTNTGVLAVAGTANQITATTASGTVTLSLPQSIATTSSPTFAGLTVNNVVTASQAGFQSASYSSGRNRVWSFGNADGYGISYFQGAGGFSPSVDMIGFHFGTAAVANSQFSFLQTGTLYASGDIYSSYSDINLKTNFAKIEDPIAKLMMIEEFTYDPNALALSLGATPGRKVGVSAQSVLRALPEATGISGLGKEYLTVQYERLVPLLVACIKSQQAQIDELIAKLK